MNLTIAGVYGGVGGILGAAMAGGKILFIEEPRKEFHPDVFLKNKKYFKPKMVTHNVDSLFHTDFLEMITKKSRGIDVMISSPPCKRFSNLANRKKDRLDDVDRKTLEMTHVIDMIRNLKPKLAIIENLPKINDFIQIHGYEDNFRLIPEKIIYGLKYHITQIQLRGNQFGISQRRKRQFWILSEYPFNYEPPTFDNPVIPCISIFEDVINLPNHDFSQHSEIRVKGFDALKTGESYYGTANNTRIDMNKTGPVITSHRTQHVHPWLPRTLTVRECARLMGYPDDFIFYGPKTQQLDQVGCGICPPIVKHIVESYFYGE